jgi:ribosomal protein S18 acetylase RimI-like enzyme
MSRPLTLFAAHPAAPQARPLLDELSVQLGARFGGDGRDSFQDWAEDDARCIFLLAQAGDEIVGCGAVRPITDSVGEVKRMYAKHPGQGIGSTVLAGLETAARKAGYTELWLETRVANAEACRFYDQHGYQRIDNYGKYAGRDNAACFGKYLEVPMTYDLPTMSWKEALHFNSDDMGLEAAETLRFLNHEGAVCLRFGEYGDREELLPGEEEAVNALLQRLPGLESVVAEAAFTHYQTICKAYGAAIYAEPSFPRAANATELLPFYRLQTIFFPEDPEAGRFGLGFSCDWEIEHDFGVQFRHWQLAEVGGEAEAFSFHSKY